MKNRSKIVLSAVLSIVLCISVITGATFALFTSDAKTNIAVTSGKVEVVATLSKAENDWVYSPTAISMGTGNTITDPANGANVETGTFFNKGTAELVDNNSKLAITNMTPGDAVNVVVNIANNSNVAIKYRLLAEAVVGTMGDLKVTVDGKDYSNYKTAWLYAEPAAKIMPLNVSVSLPETSIGAVDCTLAIKIEAVQANADTSVDETAAVVKTAEELKTLLNEFGAAGAGDNELVITDNLTLAEGETWTPIKIDGYNGAGVVTINGNGKTISGLNAPLFAGGFAGASGVVIKNLTIADSNIASTNDQGSGAFIETVDSMPTITLINCHLKDSTVTGSRTGGLIGWTSGYDKVTDGPVDTYVTIENCSVINCTIENTFSDEGATPHTESLGAIIGHAGANPATYTTIKNCIIKDNKLLGGSGKTGVILGTANVGKVTVSGCTMSGNTVNGTASDAVYGRTVFNGTGSLTIDGVSVN